MQLFVMICVLYMWHDISLGSAIKCPMVDYTCTCTCNTPLLSIVCTWHVYESKNEDLLAVTGTFKLKISTGINSNLNNFLTKIG